MIHPERLQADAKDDLRHGSRFGLPAKTLAGLVERGQPAHLLIERPRAILQVLRHRIEGAGELA